MVSSIFMEKKSSFADGVIVIKTEYEFSLFGLCNLHPYREGDMGLNQDWQESNQSPEKTSTAGPVM